MPLSVLREEKYQPLSQVKNIVAIAAGKGGVGKSSLTVNLALALSQLGYQVGILDADIYGPSIRQMLPEDQPPSQDKEGIEPGRSKGIKIITMAYFRKENEAAAVRAPIANSMIHQFIKNVRWGSLDYLLIDFPPGTGDIQLTLCQQLPLSGALMVTTPQQVALLDVRKAAHLFEMVKVPLVGVIENMSYFQENASSPPLYLFGKGGGKRLANELAVPFLGEVPLDPEICRCGDEGDSFFVSDIARDSLAAQVFLNCARQIVKTASSFSVSELQLRKVWQVDSHSFSLEWEDGVVQKISLSSLQKECPCAHCVDENTGERLVHPESIDPKVQAVEIRNVGRYALQVQFSSGCSTGIYRYDLLRGMDSL